MSLAGSQAEVSRRLMSPDRSLNHLQFCTPEDPTPDDLAGPWPEEPLSAQSNTSEDVVSLMLPMRGD
ncbi:hypothetical protein FNAPI_7711 [Fusarium napiforme]|uniref:Uncharacterized protein n=1 Tax=Fusarium napiforme TaxID=42672 RepID=A0A8H5N3H7_9HYPO|nr:hypothetical protein FNAPI_7711 [Fusarium napiforme]